MPITRDKHLAAEDYDAIVVGSGISGGWAAKELTEKGLKVLLLERGKNIEHIKDYVNATQGALGVSAPRRAHHRDGRSLPRAASRDYRAEREEPRLLGFRCRTAPIPRCGASTGTAATTSAGARSCGAATAIAGASSISRRTRRTASAVDWPIRYKDLAPWYDHVEKHAGIQGSKEGHAAAARRAVPAGDAAQLRRGESRRQSAQAVRRAPAHHPGARRRTSRRPCPAARPASTATRAGSAVPTAPTSAPSPRRCRRPSRPAT